MTPIFGSMAYENTPVAVDKSQGDIRKILRRQDADQFQFGEATMPDGTRWAGLEFVIDATLVRMRVQMKPADEKWVEGKVKRARSKGREDFLEEHYEQEERRIWRVLYWSIKARMEAVEEGVETFHQAFLAHMVDPGSNRTIWENIRGQVDAGALQIGGQGLRELVATTR